MTVAGALALAASGHLRPDDEVVLCITGNGLKTTEAVSETANDLPIIPPKLRDLSALVEQSA